MTVLVDSWAWIEYFRGSEAGQSAKKLLETAEEIIISTINVAEVYRYMLAAYSSEEALEALHFMIKRSFVIPATMPIAKKAAELKHEKKLGLGDAFVMATARMHDARIMTGDSDFKNEPDVIFLGK